MTAPTEGQRGKSNAFENVTCPFCGILCDDLEVTPDKKGLKVSKNACSRAIAGFERPVGPTNPLVEGKPVALADATSAWRNAIPRALGRIDQLTPPVPPSAILEQ